MSKSTGIDLAGRAELVGSRRTVKRVDLGEDVSSSSEDGDRLSCEISLGDFVSRSEADADSTSCVSLLDPSCITTPHALRSESAEMYLGCTSAKQSSSSFGGSKCPGWEWEQLERR